MSILDIKLDSVCAACGKPRKFKTLAYDPETYAAYCGDYAICGDKKHPNSPTELAKRGLQPKVLLPYADMREEIDRKLATEEMYQRPDFDSLMPPEVDLLTKYSTRPVSFRLDKQTLYQIGNMMKKTGKPHYDIIKALVREGLQANGYDPDEVTGDQIMERIAGRLEVERLVEEQLQQQKQEQEEEVQKAEETLEQVDPSTPAPEAEEGWVF